MTGKRERLRTKDFGGKDGLLFLLVKIDSVLNRTELQITCLRHSLIVAFHVSNTSSTLPFLFSLQLSTPFLPLLIPFKTTEMEGPLGYRTD